MSAPVTRGSHPSVPAGRATPAPSRELWDRLAPLYDLQRALERRALDALLDLASPVAEDRLLDLATGTGALLRRLAARPAPPREVLGVDTSPAMLARAAAARPGWRLRQADATRLPLASGGWDVVTAAYLLHLLDWPARRAVLDEVRRVLAPGGRLALVTVIAPAAASVAGAALRCGALAAELVTSVALDDPSVTDSRRLTMVDRRAFTALAARVRHGLDIVAGLRPLDPRPELRAAGFEVLRARRTTRGYPSLAVLARPSRSS